MQTFLTKSVAILVSLSFVFISVPPISAQANDVFKDEERLKASVSIGEVMPQDGAQAVPSGGIFAGFSALSMVEEDENRIDQRFHDNGNLKSEKEYNSDDVLIAFRQYDLDGKLKQETEYDPTNRNKNKVSFYQDDLRTRAIEFDSVTQLRISDTRYHTNGEVQKLILFDSVTGTRYEETTYDSEKNLLTRSVFDLNTSKRTLLENFDQDGLHTRHTTFDKDTGKKIEESYFAITSEGNHIRTKYIKMDPISGKLLQQNFYNKQGLVTRIKTYGDEPTDTRYDDPIEDPIPFPNELDDTDPDEDLRIEQRFDANGVLIREFGYDKETGIKLLDRRYTNEVLTSVTRFSPETGKRTLYEVYYPDGSVERRNTYDGQGHWLIYEIYYKSGVQKRLTEFYLSNGKKKYDLFFREDGTRSSLVEYHESTGSVAVNERYHADGSVARRIEYDEEGNKISDSRYPNSNNDTTPPVVSDYQIMRMNDSTVMITFKTNEPSTATLHWATTHELLASNPNVVVVSNSLKTEHMITISGLNMMHNDFHSDVIILDAAGNETIQHGHLSKGHGHGHHGHGMTSPTDEYFVIQHSDEDVDYIPNFFREDDPDMAGDQNLITARAIASGNWSDASIWENGQVPSADDTVLIPENIMVTYDVVSDEALAGIGVRGHLKFATDVDTRLKLVNLFVMGEGVLEMGTVNEPVAADVKMEVIFADRALDLTIDPQRWGNALVALDNATVRIHGTQKTSNGVVVATPPMAGDTQVVLASVPDGWQVGDRIEFPSTHQPEIDHSARLIMGRADDSRYKLHNETRTITGITQNGQGQMVVTFDQPLLYDHPGSSPVNGVTEYMPYIANLTHNVLLRSENPSGVRGHTAFLGRADVDVRYAQFKSLGRTLATKKLNSTEFDEHGNVTHLPQEGDERDPNQIARYPIHMHHLIGPVNPQDNGYQATFIGNSVDGDAESKWGITIHDTSYVLVKDNFVNRVQGSGIVTEGGGETGVVLDGNIVSGTTVGWSISRGGLIRHGDHADPGVPFFDIGMEGSGIWLRGSRDAVIKNNVTSGNSFAGIVDVKYYLESVNVPMHQGAGHDQFMTLNLRAENIVPSVFDGNISFGDRAYGIYLAWPGGCCSIKGYTNNYLITNHTAINNSLHGAHIYHAANVTIRDSVFRNDPSVWPTIRHREHSPAGIWFQHPNYENGNMVVENVDIRGFKIGIAGSAQHRGIHSVNPMIIRNSTIEAYIGFTGVMTATEEGPSINFLEGIDFQLLNLPGIDSQGPRIIDMDFKISIERIHPYQSTATYLKTSDGNYYQIYFDEQSPNFVIPDQSDPDSPYYIAREDRHRFPAEHAGLTHMELANQFGLKIGGELAPCDAAGSVSCASAELLAQSIGVGGLAFAITAEDYQAAFDAANSGS